MTIFVLPDEDTGPRRSHWRVGAAHFDLPTFVTVLMLVALVGIAAVAYSANCGHTNEGG